MIPLLLIPLAVIFRKKKKMPEQNKYQIEKSFKEIKAIFGNDITKNIEKIYRLETRNFSSGGFLKTLGAGMTAQKKDFPYGWTSLEKFWKEQPSHAPKKVLVLKTNPDPKDKDTEKRFLVFPDLFSGMFALGLVLQKRGNDIGSWYSTTEEGKAHYRNLASKISTSITDKLA